MRSIPSDIEIARSVQLSPISSIAGKLGLNEDVLEQYGKFKAKVLVKSLPPSSFRPSEKLVLVTALNPTPAGEGKTTVSIGLADALNLLEKRSVCVCANPR